MNIPNIDQFIADMEARGYVRSNEPFLVHYEPKYSLWKSFDKGYKICIGIWDFTRSLGGEVSLSFDMRFDRQKVLQATCVDLSIMDGTMDVPEFERRCEALYNAMLTIMPRTDAA